MQIQVNGTSMDVCSDTLEDLLGELQRNDTPCAVERNGELVPWRSRSQVRLSEGDCIEIVTMVGGG
ncbi:MAG: sulfur carrier protein ThiS [Phycisphaerales bacterium]|nr:sulfur carrier protein ThiS [Phycisphaerales bacterium]